MKQRLIRNSFAALTVAAALFLGVQAKADTGLYRLYHSGLKVHLFTKDTNEYKVLGQRGWTQEGLAWNTADDKGEIVYRLYHPGLKVHLYTKDTNEYKVLGQRGWRQEGPAYRSYGELPIYRLYHQGMKKHLYTRDAYEYKVLATRGWRQEGVAFYGLTEPSKTVPPVAKTTTKVATKATTKPATQKPNTTTKVAIKPVTKATTKSTTKVVTKPTTKVTTKATTVKPKPTTKPITKPVTKATTLTTNQSQEILISGTAIDSQGTILKNTELTLEKNGNKVETVKVPDDAYLYFHTEKNQTYTLSGPRFTVSFIAKGDNDIQVITKEGNFQLGRQTTTPNGNVTLQPSAVELNKTLSYQVNESEKEVVIPANQELQAGDDVILPPSEQYPTGYAFEVVSTTTSDGQTKIQTRETSFDQLVRYVDIVKEQDISASQFIPAPGVSVISQENAVQQMEGSISASYGASCTYAIQYKTFEFSIALTGAIKAGIDYDITALADTEIFISPSITSTVKISSSKEFDKISDHAERIRLGTIPISLYNSIKVDAELFAVINPNGTVEISISTESELKGEIGLKQKKPYASFDSTLSTSLELALTGELSTGLSLEFQPGIAQLDIAAFDVTVDTGIRGELSTKLVRENFGELKWEYLTGKGTLFARRSAGYKVDLELGSLEILNLEGRFTDELLYEQELKTTPSDNQGKTSSTLDFSAMIAGDYASLAGTWKNAKGDVLVIDAKGNVTNKESNRIEMRNISENGEGSGIYIAGMYGASISILPVGVPLTNFATPGEVDISDTSKERIFITQSFRTPEEAANEMYYRQK
ncbi:DUF6287 domain-containing protein [Streptococcus ovis]|uniref:DUF6287 domain-containing protein n=1 Tax=Streptococcus ovis TaxID=82806 RepID=UPI00036CB67D|nr:DUF6287 domain-containing protein [Streptococcus ovis]